MSREQRARGLTLAVLTGAVVAVGAPTAWWVAEGRGPGQFGGAAARAAAGVPADTGGGPPPPAVTPPGPPAGPGTSPARLADVVPRTDPPVEVLVDGRAVPVDAVGLDADAQVVVPDDVRRAGWYAAGPQPGDPGGAAVLVGHVDDRDQGLGAFAVLRELPAGAEVRVRTASGREVVYDVVAREQFDKAEVPLQRVFAPGGPHRLVLVSCDGEFDAARDSYTDNVVVTAVPRT